MAKNSLFDIGSNKDFVIFTNNSEDMFNTGDELGPDIILDQGPTSKVVDIGNIGNIASGIKVEMADESPIDFGNTNGYGYASNGNNTNAYGSNGYDANGYGSNGYDANGYVANGYGSNTPKNLNNGFGENNYTNNYGNNNSNIYDTNGYANGYANAPSNNIKKQSRQQRQEISKIPSNASDATIEAEPITERKISKNKKISRPEETQQSMPEQVNFDFDDLLDNRKLRPVINDTSSVGEESHSTIRASGGYEYPEIPPSPGYKSEPVEFPTTFQNDRAKQQENKNQYQREQPPQEEQPTSKYANEEDEKMDLLLKLKALETRKGITLSRHFNIKSSLEELRMEYRNQSKALEAAASIKMMKRGLIFCVTGIEFLNRKYDPLNIKLDGWGEDIMENIMDYDGILERLHEKYGDRGQMEPEIELVLALGASAFYFHLNHTLFKTAMPQFTNVLKENPNVLNGLMGVVKEASKRNQSVPVAANDINGPSNVGGNMQSPGLDIGGILGQLGITPGVLNDFAKNIGNPPPPPQSTRDFKEPPVSDLYRKMVESSQSRNDDALSVSSDLSDSKSIGKAVISPLPKGKKGTGGGKVIKLL